MRKSRGWKDPGLFQYEKGNTKICSCSLALLWFIRYNEKDMIQRIGNGEEA